ncbi:phenylalanine--tRNA ligase subunit beta [Candidatus Woesearchaeota archaeon]|nr:phenylalanine--tRNA ligase subunit beta [Candidatus Woesearchaeota archaeon]
MPTISFSHKDFQKLLGRKMPIEEFSELLLLYAKAELKPGNTPDDLTVELDDTNQPYIWSVEGLARLLRGITSKKEAAPLRLQAGNYSIEVDESVKNVRPCIAAFVAKGVKLDDYLLKQLIQMQEKFDTGYGRRRQKVSIGLYSYKRISFPIRYTAVKPDSVKFIPLGFEKELNLKQILEQHPKGQEYGWILKNSQDYPLLLDSNGQILSFPPIINSNFTGRLEVGDSELLFEATGHDDESLNLAASIFAQNLQDRGFAIHSVIIKHKSKTTKTPSVERKLVKITPQAVEAVTGLKLKSSEISSLLQKMGYQARGETAIIPTYRADIMHPVDVIEDVAIAYGFDRISEEPLRSYTVGKKDRAFELINPTRKLIAGLGFQEIFSHILTDKKSVTEKSVELQNFMSETHSAVRNSLLPQLLDVFAKNKHSDYPQKIFEEGLVASREATKLAEWRSIALASAHSKADFTEMKQYLSALLGSIGLQLEVKPAEHTMFIKGRVGSILVNKQHLGFIGEVKPEILEKHGIEMPVAAAELNLSLLP